MFSPKVARKDLKRYRKRGLKAVERQMMASLPTDAVAGARVLELGGGIGTIEAELIDAGAARGTIIELVPGYEPYARALATDKGFSDRLQFHVVDALNNPDEVGNADVVVLNRVVCCSPDGIRLTAFAAHRANRLLLLVYPRNRFTTRLFGALMNTALRIVGRSFRLFLHSPAALQHAAEAEGLVTAATGRSLAWEFTVFRRPHATA